MRAHLIRLPVLALILAALACTLPGGPKPTPAPSAALPTPSPLAPTSTLPAELSPTPVAATATAQPPTADLTATPIAATVTAPTPLGINLSNTGKAEAPRLAFDAQDTLHLVWLDQSARGTGDLFHRQQGAGGDWSKAENLTSDFDLIYGDVSLIRDQGGNICVVFSAAKTRGNPFSIGLYQRCQAGTTWSPATKLAITKQSGVTLRGYSPARGAGGTVHAVFISGTGTINFDDVQLTTDSNSFGPALAIDKAGGYHVAWVNLGSASSPATVQYRFSSDQGKTWQAAQALSTDKNAPIGSVARLVADDAGNVHMLWAGSDDYYRRWTPSGGWGPPAALGGGQRGPNPSLAIDTQGLTRVVWERTDGLPYVVQAVDGTWSAPRALSHLQSGEPQIVTDSAGAARVAWLANKDVYYLVVP